ncbi:hypothetical protein Scep_008702 [Stephania cephalantha]|uniref:Uncharacterized protein n=1 Tax=Stephania cephalantha TaxID=152367 RepID=A0AAP0JSA0_9MAGN
MRRKIIFYFKLFQGKENNVGDIYQQVIEIGESQPPLESQVEKGKKKKVAPSKKSKRKVVARNKQVHEVVDSSQHNMDTDGWGAESESQEFTKGTEQDIHDLNVDFFG